MEEKSAITSTGSRKFVTIKIEVDTLVEVFNDMYNPDFKIKNKLGFACSVGKTIVEYLTSEGLDLVMETMADGDDDWLKMCDEDEY